MLSFEAARPAWAAVPLVQALGELGYVEGQTLSLEYRGADGQPERLRALAAELARAPADVIVATSWQAIAAAQQSTTIVPIVMAAMVDPVGRRHLHRHGPRRDAELHARFPADDAGLEHGHWCQ